MIFSTQQLANLVRKKSYKAAVLLALSLEQPRQLLAIFKEVLLLLHEGQHLPWNPTKATNGTDTEMDKQGVNALEDIIISLNSENLSKLLLYIRDWNTNGRTSVVAQQLLVFIFHIYSPSSLAKLPRMKEVRLLTQTFRLLSQKVIRALIPYTERHQSHILKLMQDSYILDYTLAQMNLSSLSLQVEAGTTDTPTTVVVPASEERKYVCLGDFANCA